jgi:hypothetical protein
VEAGILLARPASYAITNKCTCAFVGDKNLSVIKMHGATIKIIDAQQAKLRNNYKNTS